MRSRSHYLRARVISLFVGCLASLLAGCGGDDPTGPAPHGSVRFTFTGSVEGTFEVSGPLESILQHPEAGAAAWHGVRGEYYWIQASRPGIGGGKDLLDMSFGEVTAPVTLSLCPTEGEFPAEGCVTPASFSLGSGALLFFTELSLTLTSLSPERLEGTFTGRLTGTSLSGETLTLVITNGVLDLPVRDI